MGEATDEHRSTTASWSVGLDSSGRWWSGMPERQIASVGVDITGLLAVRGRMLWRLVIPTLTMSPDDVTRLVRLSEPDPRWSGVGVQEVAGSWLYLWCTPPVAREILQHAADAGFAVDEAAMRAEHRRVRRLI